MRFPDKAKYLLIGTALTTMPFLAFSAVSTDTLRQQIRSDKQAFVAERQAKREEFRNQMQSRIEAMKKHFGEVRANRIEQFFGKMAVKMEGAIDRLNKHADNIEAYLDKLSAQGKDVSVFKTKLEDARAKIKKAETALQDAKTKFSSMALSADPKKSFKDVKDMISQVTSNIKDARKALIDIITSVKGLSEKATSTEAQ